MTTSSRSEIFTLVPVEGLPVALPVNGHGQHIADEHPLDRTFPSNPAM
jgi:hypothetical protein